MACPWPPAPPRHLAVISRIRPVSEDAVTRLPGSANTPPQLGLDRPADEGGGICWFILRMLTGRPVRSTVVQSTYVERNDGKAGATVQDQPARARSHATT